MEKGDLMCTIKRLNKGSMIFTVIFAVFLIMILFTFFTVIVFKNNVNLVLHNLKNDLYLISKNSVFSIERNIMGEDIEEIDEYELEYYISNEIRQAWNLNYSLKNGKGIIKSADILELEVLNAGDKDPVSGKMMDSFSVHIVVGVKVKPIILISMFEDIFYFKLHEDLKLNKLEA